ncbi:hypothetical protein [Novosphingobium malaysiense]|uniref:RcnB family protein n=1 Tax=Novosphingobium malaysiense TaxID=1348853 RepID=A0A0B1ZSK1_9SPHN|nr:hypothetical protein [Novosphingobium malaysiense]KHK92469.1 hypothetical protein LK12_06625 [Novosphingobium malaysiense]
MRTIRSFQIGTAASLALVAGALAAQPGGNGKEHGNKGGPNGSAAQAAQNAGHGNRSAAPAQSKHAGKPQQAQAKPQKPEPKAAAPSRKIQAKAEDRGPNRPQTPQGNDKAKAAKGNNAMANRPAQAQDGKADNRGKPALATRPQRGDIKRVSYEGPKGRKITVPTNDRVRVVTRQRDINWSALDKRRVYDGCPPGLAKKYNGCTPPGLDREPTTSWYRPTWYLHDYDRNARYRYADGYLLRLGSGTQILGYMPLLGGALSIGQTWPTAYRPVSLPTYYDDYYGLGSPSGYRYYNDTIYRVDPDTAAIQSIAAMLTGNDITIGQPMPPGYDVYNVPYRYRDQYVDGPDAMYRYSDGYIYQLDPTTRLVQAAIELLI